MRYDKINGCWTNSTKTNTIYSNEAFSYDWYRYALKIGQKWLLIDKAYSVTTAKHIGQFRTHKEYPEAIYVNCKDGIKDTEKLSDSKEYIVNKILKFKAELASKKHKRSLDAMRLECIKQLESDLSYIESYLLGKKFDQDLKKVLD